VTGKRLIRHLHSQLSAALQHGGLLYPLREEFAIEARSREPRATVGHAAFYVTGITYARKRRKDDLKRRKDDLMGHRWSDGDRAVSPEKKPISKGSFAEAVDVAPPWPACSAIY
jgi:hypothetical protein